MEPEEYLKKILKSQELTDEQIKALQSSRSDIENLLTLAFSDSNPTIRYAGSKVKDTMNQISFDLDIACYFAHDDTVAGETLEEIYTNVRDFLSTSYTVEQKTSALRIKSMETAIDFHIDVVPGRFVDESKTDVFLYQYQAEKQRLKTNLDVHIKHIKESGVVDIIRLAKIWKVRFSLPIKTFVLELLVVKYVARSSENPLTTGIKSFWEELSSTGEMSVEDPANPEGNDLSTIFDDNIKQTLKQYADIALQAVKEENWEGIFGSLPEEVEATKTQGTAPTGDYGEQFLSDFGISSSIQYQMKINAKVVQDGWRPFFLLGTTIFLRKQRSLEFFIQECRVPQPYDVKWKVKNYGEEATRAGDLRGEITDDRDSRSKKEHTKYEGRHYVECYVLKDGTCVASDRIYVPIGSL